MYFQYTNLSNFCPLLGVSGEESMWMRVCPKSPKYVDVHTKRAHVHTVLCADASRKTNLDGISVQLADAKIDVGPLAPGIASLIPFRPNGHSIIKHKLTFIARQLAPQPLALRAAQLPKSPVTYPALLSPLYYCTYSPGRALLTGRCVWGC